MLSPDLILAYSNTIFKVFYPPISIKIEEVSTPLDDLLTKHQQTSWAYITAYNPCSKALSEIENEARHQQLKNEVAGFTIFEGEGVGEDPTWQPEKSLLIIGIEAMEACRIGNLFEQNAIVLGSIGQPAVLKLLR